MNIFSEIYGAYYRTVQRLLEKCEITESDVYKVISEEAFADSGIFIPQKLLPKNGFSDWGLFKEKDGRRYASVLKHKPKSIVTLLQKRWLKAQLNDPKFRLFVKDTDALEAKLKDTEPLYRAENFRTTDVFTDGDPYGDEGYIKNFRTIANAVHTGELVDIAFVSGKNNSAQGLFLPLRLEYSRKNDKFRVYCLSEYEGQWRGSLINLGRVVSAKSTHMTPDVTADINEFFLSRRCREPVTVEVTSERNGIGRFMMEFAAYEKYTEQDAETGKCTVKLWYDRSDETEVLIRLLSFGPVLEIISPESMRAQAAERVRKQKELLERDN